MTKPQAKLIEMHEEARKAQAPGPQEVLDAILKEARALAPGSDVEGFMERRLRELALSTRGAVAQARASDQAAASREADFPPSALPLLRGADAPGADGTPPRRDDVGPA